MTSSPEPVNKNFDILANGDYLKTWSLVDSDTGDSLLLSSSQLYMKLKPAGSLPGAASVMTVVNHGDSTVTGFVLAGDIATSGEFRTCIKRADMQALLGDLAAITYDYDFGVLDVDSVFIIYSRGTFTFRRGVTYGI